MSSNYVLRLQAQLDTTQVKQELQKLRTLQQQALGNNNQQRGTTQNTQNLGNLNNLNSTLAKLNASIAQLNANIQKLNIFNQKQLTQTQVNKGSALPTVALGSRNTSVTNNRAFNVLDGFGTFERDQQVDRFIRDGKFRQQYMQNVVGAKKPALAHTQAGIMGALPLYHTLNALPPGEQALFYSQAKKPAFQQWYASQYAKPQTPQQVATALTPDMKRMMAGMAFGQGVNVLLNMNQQLGIGDDELFSIGGMKVSQNNALNGFGKIASYGAMGSAAGPWGAAIGAAIGAIETFADVLMSNAKEIEDELARDNMAIDRGRQVGEARRDYEYDRMMKRNLEGEDLAEVQHMKDRLERSIKENREMLDFVSENGYRASNSITYLQGIQRDEARLDAVNQYIENFNKQKDTFAKQYGAEKLSLERYDESRYNTSLIANENTALIKERRGYYNDRAEKSRQEYETYLKNATVYAENGKFRLSREQMEKATTSKSDWQYYMNEFNKLSQFKASNTDQLRLVDNLKEVMSKLTPPSMENVNSLAGQGLMINRRDDYAREQVMEDYQREQTELQRQIKDILQQDEHGSTESIIW